MNGDGNRKKLSGRSKLKIVMEGLVNSTGIAEVCRANGVSTGQYYQWRDKLLSQAEEIYKRKKEDKSTRKEERLEIENRRLKEVIAEITSENLDLKKTLGV